MILWWNLARAATPEELEASMPAAQEQLETCARRGCAPRDGARAAWLVALGTYEATGAADGALAASVRALDPELFASLPDVLQAAATEPLPWAAAGGVVAAEQVFAELFLFRAPPELGARLRALADEDPERVLDALALMRWDPRAEWISQPIVTFRRDEQAKIDVGPATYVMEPSPDGLGVSVTLNGTDAHFEWGTQGPWSLWSEPRVFRLQDGGEDEAALLLAVWTLAPVGRAAMAEVQRAMEERRQRILDQLGGGGARARRRATDEALALESALVPVEMRDRAAERLGCTSDATSVSEVQNVRVYDRDHLSAVVRGCGREALVTYVDAGRGRGYLTDDFAAREAAVRDLGCTSIEVEFLGESARRIRGCGREAVYVSEVGGWRAVSITP